MDINKIFYKKLSKDKIRPGFNKNPIRVSLFVSFLTVPVTRSTDHLGSGNGWTLLVNEEHNLKIKGGISDGGDWLYSIQYGNRLDNQYNNYVNPFYLFDIMNSEGKKFFMNYYREDIEKLIDLNIGVIEGLNRKIEEKESELKLIRSELERIANSIVTEVQS